MHQTTLESALESLEQSNAHVVSEGRVTLRPTSNMWPFSQHLYIGYMPYELQLEHPLVGPLVLPYQGYIRSSQT